MSLPVPQRTYSTPYGLASRAPKPVKSTRVPAATDLGYDVCTLWSNGSTIYGLVSTAGGTASWQPMGGGSSVLSTLTGNSGGAISPTAGNINILGTSNQIVISGSGSTLTASFPSAGITMPSGNIIDTQSSVGADVFIRVANTDNTSGASRAGFEAVVGGSSSGDPYILFTLTGTTDWIAGVDNSAADSFVVANSTALGSSNIFTLSRSGNATVAVNITSIAGNLIATNGNLVLSSIGNGVQVKTGSNARLGTASLTGGAVTVANTSVTANTRIFLTTQVTGGTPGFVRISNIVANTSFDITSSEALDTSLIAWYMVESIP